MWLSSWQLKRVATNVFNLEPCSVLHRSELNQDSCLWGWLNRFNRFFVLFKLTDSGSSCDALLTDDWFYVPLLEAYTQGNKRDTTSDEELEAENPPLSYNSEVRRPHKKCLSYFLTCLIFIDYWKDEHYLSRLP